MAKQTIEVLTDDLSGEEATETVRFGLDGVEYEIDLTRQNAAGLRKSLSKYLKGGRRVGGRRVRGAGAASRGKRDYDIAELRAWAKRKRVKVPARGRIPQAVIEQYKSEGGR